MQLQGLQLLKIDAISAQGRLIARSDNAAQPVATTYAKIILLQVFVAMSVPKSI